MRSVTDFLEHVLDTLRIFGPVEAKRMFGGWGLYHEGVFFALIAEDLLYFKTDDVNSSEFEGLAPFTFEKKGKRIVTHYRRAPEAALDSPAEMAKWARLGYEAALRPASAKATVSRGARAAKRR